MLSRRHVYERASSTGQASRLQTDNVTLPGNHDENAPVSRKGSSTPEEASRYQHEGSTPSRELYTPFWHRLWTLLAFFCSFIGLFLILIAIFAFSSTHKGLTTAESQNYYLWTYGPTAVFTLLASLWAQVEYRAKQISPWFALRQHDQSGNPHKHVLLDYISPISPVSLYDSIRNSHPNVTWAIVGSLLLKLAIVLSTNLFQLDGVSIESSMPIHLSNQFAEQGSFDRLQQDLTNVTAFSANPNTPAAVVMRTLTSNSTYPWGTTDDFAFQQFATPSTARGNLTADVKGFTAFLECEETQLDHTANLTCKYGEDVEDGGSATRLIQLPHDLHFTSPGCDISSPISPTTCDAPSDGYYGFTVLSHCGNDKSDDNYRMVVSNVLLKAGRVQASTSILCAPTWSVQNVTVTTQTRSSDGNFEPLIKASNSSVQGLANVTNVDLVNSVINCSSNAQPATSFWQVMLSSAALNSSAFMDLNTSKATTSRVFSAISAQIATQYLMDSVQSSGKGFSAITQQRLLVSNVTFGLTVAILLGMTLLTAGLIFLASRMSSVSRDPSSVGGLATILARSDSWMNFVKSTGTCDSRQLATQLRPLSLESVIEATTQSFAVHTTSKVNVSAEFTNSEQPIMHWWHPFSASWTVYTLVLVLPLALVAALEGTYQYSQHNDGIATITASRAQNYAWSFIPALIIMALRLCYESLSFAINLFHPFSLLRKGAANARVMLSNPLAAPAAINIWTSLRDRQVSLLPGSVFQVDNFKLTTPPNATQAFGAGGASVGNAASIYSMGLILNENVPSPQWTWQNLAFPQVVLDPKLTESWSNVTQVEELTLKLPAARGNMGCTEYPALHNMSRSPWFTANVHGDHQSGEGWPVTIISPKGCSAAACSDGLGKQDILCVPENKTEYPEWTFLLMNTADYFAKWVSPAIGLGLTYGRAPFGCPSSLLWFGSMEKQKIKDFTLLECAPFIETVDVNVTFEMPGFQVSSSKPPVTIESTARPVSYDTPSVDDGMDTAWGGGSPNEIQTGGVGEVHLEYDDFFGRIMLGKQKVDPETLLGPSNVDKLKNMTNAMYSLWMAQELNFMSRSTSGSNTGSSSQFPANFTVTENRLVQSAVSTRVLEALLIATWFCAVVAMVLCKTRKVLPKNPCTIAGLASLLAGSELLETIPEGSEWCNDEELRRSGIFEGGLFRLG
ncbi:MAG: hypothetical protein M1828_002943 [Chrysothrix sp. TS-e1954]|nr:MAG: hypothetical protein M1828_002943 [Chrysothrix sp. TS-e1954]